MSCSSQRIVLLGIGHTHAHILRRWAAQPIAGCELICISNSRQSTYSGMLPGVLSGHYQPAAMTIDLPRLASHCGAELILAEVLELDLPRKVVRFTDRAPLAFDLLSVGIGSIPRPPQSGAELPLFVPIKPMQTFLTRLDRRLHDLVDRRAGTAPLRVVVVGGGVGGVEICLCLPSYMQRVFEISDSNMSVVTSSDQVPLGVSQGAARRIKRVLSERGVTVHRQEFVTDIHHDSIETSPGKILPADIVLWAAAAMGPPLLAHLGLACDDRGFLVTRSTLQVRDHDHIFAVGDSGSIEGKTVPKAGVYAVRQGPVLWENLQRAVQHLPLVPYHPQVAFLKLINLGDGRAVGEYRDWSWMGRTAWWLKDHIDSKFMAQYSFDRHVAGGDA